MSRHFAAITYTESVKAAQRQYNGRELQLAAAPDAKVELSARETEYIAARDSFYLATVSETGWPHVQHRGGPRGFLKVLGPDTLGFADCNGNRQYLSIGNLRHDNRVAMILMDYPNRRRLKLLGHVRVIDVAEASPELVAKVMQPSKELPAERILLITVVAFDWNCSQYITPRYTESELQSRGISPNPTNVP
ncbi:MAG TPA: pyridoxamine 5'-phosphate oxidase family protein [Aromatoleum sp.]|uniref:pyridoxamine 5'-phosphate oxidase family protein n=1 Tax=Aromatoleum sp. TaxID=2307007 RepID=UPI002B48B491|nr:pyridoxamine 5'-phosphate oxidase family protein [Aromatoleum sp.]HJV26930.1 pyridoxamine 5'-phosphate oxidase family protein [Aromatoleum sp.]